MRLLVVLTFALLAACNVSTGSAPDTRPTAQTARPAPRAATRAERAEFERVVRRVGPVAVRTCVERTRGVNCNYRIFVDERPDQPPNAYQTLSRGRTPVIVVTTTMIAEARNADELAFVIGHEAAHHIKGHIAERQARATGGAILGSLIAAGVGLGGAETDLLQQSAATIGARAFAKDEELEADALGTLITARAGYNPVRGVAYFSRAPDPGDRFLGTHPPNAERINTVRRVAAQL